MLSYSFILHIEKLPKEIQYTFIEYLLSTFNQVYFLYI